MNPKGSKSGSRGLSEATPAVARGGVSHPGSGCQNLTLRDGAAFWHASGMRPQLSHSPGVSLRYAPFNPRLPLCEPFGFGRTI
jgi:hypothetical protein